MPTPSPNTSDKSKTRTAIERTCRDEFTRFGRSILPRKVRGIREFAEQEIVIPDGPYKGLRFKPDRQPFAGLWLDAIDQGRWRRYVALGPTQSGKTLVAWVIPTLYHLFELGETVICGLPTIEVAQDKWEEDLKPAIEASPKFRDLIPDRGEGSRGGTVKRGITFKNGTTLRFMSGGGGDEKRSAFTSRIVVVTEADKLDESGGQSREADKITQLEHRTDAYGDRARIYLECTVSFEEGRIWREYQSGTCSKIVRPCPHCREWVTPEREHLVGWQDADSETQAKRDARYVCPACESGWTEDQRRDANKAARLIHRGQSIDAAGDVVGSPPETDTLAVRWTAADNHFCTAAEPAAREWLARRAVDEENAEKELRQFVWALPFVPAKQDMTKLDPDAITTRTRPCDRGVVPDGADVVTVGVDLGKWLAHWSAIAWLPGATSHVIDYGRFEVASDDLGTEHAILAALREFRETRCEPGWPNESGVAIQPAAVWIDSGYYPDPVHRFCREAGKTYRPIQGLGASQAQSRAYSRPRSTGTHVLQIGDGWHLVLLPKGDRLVQLHADQWKSWLHERLATPTDKAGSLTLYRAAPLDHLSFARHLTAEKRVEEFKQGVGLIVRWHKVRQANHWLDATYIACAAGDAAGVKLIAKPKPKPATKPKPEQPRPRLTTPDGRPFLITDR